MSRCKYTLCDLAKELGGSVHGDPSVVVHSLASLSKAKDGNLTFLSNPKYMSQLEKTEASAVLLTEHALHLCKTNAIVLTNPYLAFARVAQLFDNTPNKVVGVHPSAQLCSSVRLGNGVAVAENVVIAEGTIIEDNVEIGANSTISSGCHIKSGSKIKSNVSIYHDISIGKNSIIHSNSVIGSDGFGNAKDAQGNWMKIPQLGGVVIGDNVEIGACTSIDRGAIDDTIIEDGVKLDNQIQIGHNVVIGKNTAMAAQTGIAGSTTVGSNCLFGGQTGVVGHINIADDVMVSSKSGISNSIEASGIYSASIPAKPHMQWKRTLARLNKLDKLNKRVSDLEKQFKQ
jgi:UDP-3-O-[3-hydroxymyristoyl] glucosamine N-acyltransferase